MSSQNTQRNAGNLVSFSAWLKSLGRTRSTGWRWRKDLGLKTVNVFGRQYIHRDEIERFEHLALSGQLEKDPTGYLAD